MFKKFLIAILIAFIIIFTLLIILSRKNVYTVQTMTIPISNKTIVVDAGHGSPDEGAVGQNGITEATLNLQIAKKLETLLKNSSCNVIMTRSDENGIQDEDAKNIRQMKVSDLKNRVKIGNSSSADIFLSIHLNKISDSKYYGWQTF